MNEWKLEYNEFHDLEWLKSVISCYCDFDEGYARALRWVMELITEGMEE